jgi:5-methyltetrahydrofolate--homocysteine methyltransferase
MKNLLERTVAGEVSISDGAMGTFLHAKGLRAGECPESWRVSRPGAVKDIAAAYVAAGSDIVETNSFGGTAYKLKPYGFADKVTEFNRAAASLAKAAIGEKGYVAASVGPTGRIVEDEGGDVSRHRSFRPRSSRLRRLRSRGGPGRDAGDPPWCTCARR